MAHRITLAAALALAATAGLALPAAAAPSHRPHAARGRMAAKQAYRAGFNRGFRAGQAQTAGAPGPVAYAQPGFGQPYGGPFNNGGVLGTGLLNGQGLLGTGVASGQGALGVGVLGF